jgi:hypothetical protein
MTTHLFLSDLLLKRFLGLCGSFDFLVILLLIIVVIVCIPAVLLSEEGDGSGGKVKVNLLVPKSLLSLFVYLDVIVFVLASPFIYSSFDFWDFGLRVVLSEFFYKKILFLYFKIPSLLRRFCGDTASPTTRKLTHANHPPFCLNLLLI